ncbi:thiamine ABC transporter substrate binding subunit [Anianabacter salinae]|uniref:thiamine ABC transporter substrate binding subunit n=1 Tax=Anianabacter salinae TaxID=2851023 RepID=UPI00225E4CA5|nr:thiamine ABC transporter substrate binding subunit [Anianabacter salinae]MBV0913615.1 thiamine ABC transporter substrate binding subunit [Anianabacter salinae]
MRFPIIATALVATNLPATAQDRPTLTVYTYDSFVTDYGPGPQIETDFEAVCGCDLQFVASGDGASLLSRLRLEGARTEADVVLGLDTNLTADAAETGLFAQHGMDDASYDLPVEWDDDMFIPYDWGYFAFVHDTSRVSGEAVPASFEELAGSDLSIVIQDPRSSTPGLGLVMWVEAAYPDRAGEIWQGLSDNIVTVTKGWSEAYGLFLDGEADMVLSYTTSPAYHLIAEDDATKAAAPFAEGHYMQIEVLGTIASTDQPELAAQFMEFMTSDMAQSVIPTTNWMYPAVTPEMGLPDGFGTLVSPDKALLFPAGEAARVRDGAIETWRTALSQ